MRDEHDDIAPLIEHLSTSSALSAAQSRRVIEDVLAYFSETVEDYVARRHAELQRRGVRNDAIFAALAAELNHRRFAPAPLTQRQIRRLIYG